MEVGDIILKADGRDVKTSNELPRIITGGAAGQQDQRDGLAQGGAEGNRRHRRRDEGRRASAQPRAQQPGAEGKAKPNKMGLVLSDLTDEQKKDAELEVRRSRSTTWRRPCAATCSQGDIIIAIIRGGVTTEAKSAAQVNDVLGKVEKGGVRHVADEARRSAILRRRSGAQRGIVRRCEIAQGNHARMRLTAEAWCEHCVDEFVHAGSDAARARIATCATRCATRSCRSRRGTASRSWKSTSTPIPALEAAFGDRVPVLLLGAPDGRYRALPLTASMRERGRAALANSRNEQSAKIQGIPRNQFRFEAIPKGHFAVPFDFPTAHRAPHPQLFDHRPHRPRQVDARRPLHPALRRAVRPRDERAGARLDGPRARARHHDQGADRGARRTGRATARPTSST